MADNRTLERTSGHARGEDERPSPYPTYRSGPVPPHDATTSKPTDVDLPRRERTYAWPAIIAIVLAAMVGIALVVWGSGEVARQDAPPLAPTGPSESDGAAPLPESGGEETIPEVAPEPGPIDVPGSD